MIRNALQFTMREMQRNVTTPRFWLAIAAVSTVLGMAGPFGTYEQLPLASRVAYWAAVAVSTYLLGDATVAFLSALRSGERAGGAATFILYGLVAGAPIAAAVWIINAIVYGWGVGLDFWTLLAYCAAIAAIVAALVRVFVYGSGEPGAAVETGRPDQPGRPAILDRLPLEQRGQLTHLSMQDHYVDVRTDNGGAMVLMRLSDAIAETRGVEGLQIHRSHWVALGAVQKAIRRGGRPYVIMKDGTELPVSRSYLDTVRSAGLF